MNGAIATWNRTGRRGFTFVEILAAMLFMAIVIPVIVEGLTTANRAGIMAARKRTAAQLAELKLNEMVVTRQWESGNASGNFGDDYPQFRWTMTGESWIETPMRQLTMEVWFQVQGRDYAVRLSTLVDEENTEDSSTNSSTGTSSSSSTGS